MCSAQYGTVLYEQCNVTVDGEADLTHKLKFATGDLECFDSIGMFVLLNAKNRARKRNQGRNKCEAIRFNELGCQGIDGTAERDILWGLWAGDVTRDAQMFCLALWTFLPWLVGNGKACLLHAHFCGVL